MNNIINNNIIYYIFNVFLKINYFLRYLYIKKIIDEGSDIFISTPCSIIWPCSSLYTAIKWLITNNRYLAKRLNNLKFTKNSSLTQKTETIENEFTLLYYLIGYCDLRLKRTYHRHICPIQQSYILFYKQPACIWMIIAKICMTSFTFHALQKMLSTRKFI